MHTRMFAASASFELTAILERLVRMMACQRMMVLRDAFLQRCPLLLNALSRLVTTVAVAAL